MVNNTANQFVTNIMQNLDRECDKLNENVTKVENIYSEYAIQKFSEQFGARNEQDDPEF